MKLHHLAIFLNLIIFASFLINCSNKVYPATQPPDNSDSFSADIRVTDNVLNTVKSLIFGDNIEWTNNGMGLWLPQESKFDDKLVEELRSVGITHLRYPGGTLSDYFDWYKALGEERQTITNPFAGGRKEYPHFGPEEFIMLCQKLDIPGTITLNAGTDTPENGAAWVKYFRDKGFQVTDFTVGNEVYMAKPEEPIAKTVQQYIDFYLKCKAGIEKAAPGTKLGAIGLYDSGAMPLSQNRNWLEDILSGIWDKMDFVDLHNSYEPILRGVGMDPDKMYPDDDFALCFMGASIAVQENIALTKSYMEKYAPKGGRNMEIHITEYGPLVYPLNKKRAVEDVAWNRSLTGALYQACLFNVFLKEQKITNANHLPLCQDIFGALIGIRGLYPERKTWRNVVYYVFQMYAKMPGREVLATEVQSPTYSTPSMGFVPDLKNVPYIDAGAYRTADGNRLNLFLINRDVKRSASVSIDPGFDTFGVESITTLGADSYKAENTPDEPDKVAPVIKMENKPDLTAPFTVVLNKHSLTVIEFIRERK